MNKAKYRLRIPRISIINGIGITAIAGTSLLTLAMMCPTVPKTTSALDCTGLTEEECLANNQTSTSATISLDAAVASVISIGLKSEMTIDVTPKSTGPELTRGITSLVVDTNNDTGYAVYMSTSNGTSLVSDSTSDNKINSITTAGSIGTNQWGYAIVASGEGKSVTEFKPIPTTSTQIKTTDTVNTGQKDIYDLTFGVAVDTSLPAGLYSGSVVISAVANPIEVSNLRQLVFMQDMTGSICENTPMPQSVNGEEITVTKQLVDIRDGKRYWVAKLRDGNCWMTQNLALDLSTSKTLTPADTNVTSNYTPQSSTRVDDSVNTTKIAGNTKIYQLSPEFTGTQVTYYDQYTAQYSWGKWKYTVLANPEATTACGNISSTDQISQKCSSRFIDVTSWQPTFTAQQDTITLGGKEYTGLIAADPNNQTYDAHYLVGNYYQWNAATAGTGGAISDANATSSICPKGWTLPRSGNREANLSRDTDNGTFHNLLKGYGVSSNLSSTTASKRSVTLRNYSVKFNATNNINGDITTYSTEADQFNVAGPPLYFVRASNIYLNSGYLYYAGRDGKYWSRTTYEWQSSTTASQAFAFGDDNVYTYNSSPSYPSRNAGLPVRCLQE